MTEIGKECGFILGLISNFMFSENSLPFIEAADNISYIIDC
jgi:hypothetical protein